MRPRTLLPFLCLLIGLVGSLASAPCRADYDPAAELQRLISAANEDLEKDKDLLGKLDADMKDASKGFGEFNHAEEQINAVMAKCDSLDVNNRFKLILQLDVSIATSLFITKNQLAAGIAGAVKDFVKQLGKHLATEEVTTYINKKWPGIWSDGSTMKVGQTVESSLRAVEEFNIALKMNYVAVDTYIRRENAELAAKEGPLNGNLLILKHSQIIREKGNLAVAALEQLKADRLAQYKTLAKLKGVVEDEIKKLQADIQSWDRQLRLMGIVKQANEWSKAPDPVTFPPNPSYDFGAAASKMREAWQKLAQGEYSCNSYFGALSDAQSGAQNKMSELMRPYYDAANAACAPGPSDACSAAWARVSSASASLWNAYKTDIQGTQRQLYDDAKAVADGPLATFAGNLLKWDKNEVKMNVWGEPYMQKMQGQHGDWLASAIWRHALSSSAGSTDFPFPIYSPSVRRIAESQKFLKEWQDNAERYLEMLEKRHDEAMNSAGTVAGYASGASGLGETLRPKVEQWECFRSYVSNYSEAISHLQNIRYESDRLSRFEAPFKAISADGEAAGKQLVAAAEKSLERTKQIVGILGAVPPIKDAADKYVAAAKELANAQQGNLDTAGGQVHSFLGNYRIHEPGLKALERRVQAMSNPKALEQEARTQVPGLPEYDAQSQVLDSANVLALKTTVNQMLARIGAARDRYASAYDTLKRLEAGLDASLASMRGRIEPIIPELAPAFYLDSVLSDYTETEERMALYMRSRIGPPKDLPDSGLGSGTLIDQYAKLAQRYHELVDPILPQIRAERHAPAMEALQKKLESDTSRLQGLDSAAFASESGKYNTEAYQLIQKASNEGKIDPKGKLSQAYGAIINRLSAISSAYYQKQRISQAESELRNLISGVNAFLANPDAMGGWSTAQQWIDSIGYTKRSVEGGPVRNEAGVSALLSQLDGLMEKLKTVASQVDAGTLARDTQAIQAMYRDFVAAYQGRNLPGLMRFLADNWQAADGSGRFDMEDTLSNSFRVFDQITFKINNINIRRVDRNYEVSYQAMLSGKIRRMQKAHEETSNVVDTVIITPEGPRIQKTTGMLH